MLWFWMLAFGLAVLIGACELHEYARAVCDCCFVVLFDLILGVGWVCVRLCFNLELPFCIYSW